ncbi:phenylacetate--CoA ligase family protein [Macrococcus hajekii]|uniref:Phenylacetate--CoA ligase family protein n=1 Tax=Macrococcus hajekii TaxID=198482 RepID=A0A4R6BNE2_9STAP|nr:phenylacetate--CoA ligase family protein [Macrococcus hajekii]TDM03366.1 phenylacetate--CoA ligase family protein [Macrococcus hajekii]GGA98269.1 capsular polysaccharide biosynthesis protein CapK [Macrococcus hajekii]
MVNFIYDHSPIFLQNIFVTLKGIQIYKQRYNKNYMQEISILKNTDEFELQRYRLKEFLNYVRYNSEYFALKLPQINEENELNKMKDIPYLTKEDIRNHIDDIITRKKDLILMETGGSTGKRLKIYTHYSDISRRIAYLDYFKEKHGVKKGMRRASIGGRVLIPANQKSKVFWRHNYVLNQLLFSIFHAGTDNIKYYVQELNRFKPQSIDGVPSVIHRMAQYINDNQIELTFQPIAIFPTAETLTIEMKADIERAFRCKTYDQYASSEGAPFIIQNNEGGYDICPATGYFELEKIEGNIYELIVTAFYTTTTPLIRYKIGDAVELIEPLPDDYKQTDIKIKRIIGRNNDFLMSNEKGIVYNINLASVSRQLGANIKESQFIQNKLDEIIINLVVDHEKDKELIEKNLTEVMNMRFGNSTKYKVNYVDEIERTQGGKTRLTINNLDKFN